MNRCKSKAEECVEKGRMFSCPLLLCPNRKERKERGALFVEHRGNVDLWDLVFMKGIP